ncbi:MAG: NAD(P)/FAD-dependent oxidoreductase [Haloferacaceae archaeon]
MSHNEDPEAFEVAVVGGGPAGLSAALYTTRLGHDTVLIDRGGGRAAMMAETHNVVGITEDVSGKELIQTAREQLRSYGTTLERGFVDSIERDEDGPFRLEAGDAAYLAEAVVLATGFTDERPDPPLPRTSKGLHYCLHCDAYMFVDEPVYVMGHDDPAAYVAMIMLNFTDEVDLLTRGHEPEWSDETAELLAAHPVEVVEPEVAGVRNGEDGWLEALEFADGTVREYRGGFAVYGSDYHTDLAEQLGCERNDDGTIAVDDHGNTSVDGVYAVGDVTPGHNQIPVAMGEGAKAGLDIYYDLRRFPMDLDEIDARGGIDPEEVPGLSPAIRAAALDHDSNVGRRGQSAADD